MFLFDCLFKFSLLYFVLDLFYSTFYLTLFFVICFYLYFVIFCLDLIFFILDTISFFFPTFCFCYIFYLTYLGQFCFLVRYISRWITKYSPWVSEFGAFCGHVNASQADLFLCSLSLFSVRAEEEEQIAASSSSLRPLAAFCPFINRRSGDEADPLTSCGLGEWWRWRWWSSSNFLHTEFTLTLCVYEKWRESKQLLDLWPPSVNVNKQEVLDQSKCEQKKKKWRCDV